MEKTIIQIPTSLNLSDISKGHLSEAFQYSENTLQFNKTGSEIKAQINVLLVSLGTKCEMYQKELVACKCSDIEPIGEISSYRLKGYSIDQFTSLPKLYTYEQKYPEDGPTVLKSEYGVEQVTRPAAHDVETKKKLQEYNELAGKVIDCMVDAKLATTLKNGLSDKTSYKLTLRQAAALGF